MSAWKISFGLSLRNGTFQSPWKKTAFASTSSVSVLIVPGENSVPDWFERSARYMSIEKARLSFENVAASSLLSAGAVARSLAERSSSTGARSGEVAPSEPPQPDRVTPTMRKMTLSNTFNELSARRMTSPSRMTMGERCSAWVSSLSRTVWADHS